MHQLSLSTCMHEMLRWHDIPEPVFFNISFLEGIYRANRSLWTLQYFYYRHYDFVIATEPTVPCDHFEMFTIAIMTLLTATDENVYFLLFVVKSCPSSFNIYYRIWMTGLLLWVTRRTGATSWAVAAYLIL
jgi:hypothetical protein